MPRSIAVMITLVLSTSAAAWAAGPLQTVRVHHQGQVWSNSKELSAGAHIQLGDELTTGSDGSAVLESPQMGRVEIRNDSAIEIQERSLRLEEGSLLSRGSEIQLGRFTIIAKEPGRDSLFAVANRDGRQLVAAHRGAVMIHTRGAAPLLLPAGSYAEPRRMPEEEEDDDDGGGAAGAGGGAATTSSAGWTIGSLSHGKSVALVVGLGAAATAGTVAGFTVLSDSEAARSAGTQ